MINSATFQFPYWFQREEANHSNDNSECRAKRTRNPWGSMSYADMITEAILNAPEKRLTLNQIYDWIVKNVPYFSNKGDINSSHGWKNSIRHNLSLHERFVRLNPDGGEKSSFWTVNLNAEKYSRRKQAKRSEESN
ncbi:hypothetical protein B4U80_03293 [Leptotrombidium deliense]|uniref:Fork-head domain-containing protein n=1 Tax=Leptotrombidium deliense TaxID=299467 RepID=A0A443SF58_9ACAR|nr:hypothetical protein B4U80_03293 [Leptotrombidium deliense]